MHAMRKCDRVCETAERLLRGGRQALLHVLPPCEMAQEVTSHTGSDVVRDPVCVNGRGDGREGDFPPLRSA